MRTIEDRLKRDSAAVRRRIHDLPTRPVAVVRTRARRQRVALTATAFAVVFGGFAITSLLLAGGVNGSASNRPPAPNGTVGREATPGDSIVTGSTFDGSIGTCSSAVTRGTLYLGGPAGDDNLAASGFMFSVPAGLTATDLAESFVSQAIIGDGCEQQVTASVESGPEASDGAVVVDVTPPATPGAVHLKIQTASQGDIIGVTGVRGITTFSVTVGDRGTVLHTDALPDGAMTISVRFRKGDDVWELTAPTIDREIPLAVPPGETDRFPDVEPEWVLFTVQDQNGAVLDVGGRLIP